MMEARGRGHNSEGIEFQVEVRYFNSLAKYAPTSERKQPLAVQPGTTVGEIIDRLGVPRKALHLILINGRDITPGLVGDNPRMTAPLEAGDIIALSGPVPYSYGYGAPVV